MEAWKLELELKKQEQELVKICLMASVDEKKATTKMINRITKMLDKQGNMLLQSQSSSQSNSQGMNLQNSA